MSEFGFKTLDEYNFYGKKVLLRAEFNVPLDGNQKILDDSRIKLTLPTIQHILDDGATRLVLMAHLGRPKGKVVESMSLAPVAKKLSELLNKEVEFSKDCINAELPETGIVLLENLRFHDEEKKGDRDFAEKLSSYADVYVNDAFGNCHRDDASMTAVTKFIPSIGGLILENEIKKMSDIMKNPERPLAFIMGCAKMDKISLLEKMLEKCDYVLMGGAIIFTFLKSKGVETGRSLVDEEHLDIVRGIYEKSKNKLILPDDFVVAKKKDETSESRVVAEDDIPLDMIGLDIGPESVKKFKSILKDCKTIVWNGPLGVFEIDRFGMSTQSIAEYISGIDAKTLIGGGDTASAMKKYGLSDKFTHVSSGGGASLMFIEGTPLPAIEALRENVRKFS